MSTLTILSRTLQRGFIASLAAASLLAGCATGPRYSPPAAPDVTTYTGPAAAGSATVSDASSRTVSDGRQSVVMGSAPRDDWWRELNSPQLDEVVALALRNNLSLETARATLAAAQESAKAARGARNIQVDVGADVGRKKYDSDFLGPLAKTFPTFSSYSVGPTVSYDFDVFGGTRHRIEQADAMTAYNREQLRAARLEVVSDTVTQALRIASLRAQIEVVTRVLDDDNRTLELVQAARRVGVVSDIDVLTATNQRDRDRALLPPLHQELAVARDALAILVGQPPAKWSAPQFALEQFNLPRELRLVLPSDLVRARPDIQAAEAELHAASAAVGIATANLYPRITLSSGWAESAPVEWWNGRRLESHWGYHGAHFPWRCLERSAPRRAGCLSGCVRAVPTHRTAFLWTSCRHPARPGARRGGYANRRDTARLSRANGRTDPTGLPRRECGDSPGRHRPARAAVGRDRSRAGSDSARGRHRRSLRGRGRRHVARLRRVRNSAPARRRETHSRRSLDAGVPLEAPPVAHREARR